MPIWDYGIELGLPGSGTPNPYTDPLADTVGQLLLDPAELANGGVDLRAVFGGSGNWLGCNIYYSFGPGTAYRPLAFTGYKSIIGEVEAPFVIGAPFMDVDVSASPGDLPSTDAAGLTRGVCMVQVDDEIISYQTATLIAADVWRLTTLQRAWFDTEEVNHAAAEFCALLSPGQKIIQVPDHLLLDTMIYKAATVGYGGREQSLAAVVAQNVIITGRGLHLEFQRGRTWQFIAGEALDDGDYVYLKAADQRVWKAVVADDVRLGCVQAPGVPVVAGDKVYVQMDGVFDLAVPAAAVADLVYCSAAPGVLSTVNDGRAPVGCQVTATQVQLYPARAGGVGANTYDGLTDTPAGKALSAYKVPRVNAALTLHEYDRRLWAGASWPAVAGGWGAADKGFRTDFSSGLEHTYDGAKWWPEWKVRVAAEETLFQLLEGSLNTRPVAATTWTALRINAADTKGMTEEIIAWAELATRIQTDTAGDLIRFYITTSGGNVVCWQDTGHGIWGLNWQDEVWVDGIFHGFWDQSANASYTIAALAAGTHSIEIRCDAAAAPGDFCCFAQAVIPQYANQDAAVTNDEIEILLPFGRALLYTNGTGRTRGVMGSPLSHAAAAWLGEGIDHRLPMGTGPTVQTLARSAILEAGKTMNTFAGQMLRWMQLGNYYRTTVFGRSALRPGLNIKAGAAATFGHQYAVPSGDYAFHSVGDHLSASIYVAMAVPALARVTAVGAGTDFEVGEPVLFVGTYLNSAAAIQDPVWWTLPHAYAAFGLYKLADV